MTQLEINVQKKLILLEEKEYVLKYYFDNLDMLAGGAEIPEMKNILLVS